MAKKAQKLKPGRTGSMSTEPRAKAPVKSASGSVASTSTTKKPETSKSEAIRLDEALQQRVLWVVAQQFGISTDDSLLDKRIREDLNSDSLDDVELIMELEEAFTIDVPDDLAGGWTKGTVRDLIIAVQTFVSQASEA